jgi:hypothetical protein
VAALGRNGLEKVPGNSVAKQCQAAGDRLLGTIDEDLAFDAKPGILGGPHGEPAARGYQRPRQKQPHDDPQRHGSQGVGMHAWQSWGFHGPSAAEGAGTLAEVCPGTKAEPRPFSSR